jgi:hypothetical protein
LVIAFFTSSAKGKAINPGCAAVQCRDGEKRALMFETTALKDKSQKMIMLLLLTNSHFCALSFLVLLLQVARALLML